MKFQDLQIEAEKFCEKKDCGVKALAVSCGVSYEDAHAAMELAGRKQGDSSWSYMYPVAIDLLDCKMINQTSLFQPRAKTIRTIGRILPKKNYLIFVRKHAVGAADGKIVDWSKGRCHRIQEIFEIVKK